LLDRAFTPFINNNYDNMTMALILAKAITDGEIDTYEGAYLIGEISEIMNRQKDLWDFKCHAIQYNDYEQDKMVDKLGFNKDNLTLWQGEIIDKIKSDARVLLNKYKIN
jgi:hypothetical protein